MGKITFWGHPNRIQHKHSAMQKYKYVLHQIGEIKRDVYVKLPNVEYMKKSVQARKLMHMRYVFGGTTKMMTSFRNWTEWRQRLHQLTYNGNTGLTKMKYKREREPRSAHGAAEESLVKQPSRVGTDNIACDRDVGPVDESIGSIRADDKGTKNATFLVSEPHDEDSENDIAVDESLPSIQEVARPAANTAPTMPRSGVKRKLGTASEDLETKVKKLVRSTPVCGIVKNSCASALDSIDGGIFLHVNSILMQTMQAAVYSHDWSLASKCTEGLSREITKTAKYWIMWNGGFLALINIYRDDVSRIVDFARYVQEIMEVYPPRLKVEVGTWLTQKGYFANASFLMEAQDYSVWNQPNFRNPRRSGIDFIVDLFNAADQYSCYKRDAASYSYGPEYPHEERHETLCRNGEYALSLFQNLLELCDSIDNDGTIFIEPFVELLLEFRTKESAQAVFEDLCCRSFGNGVLEELYLKFLQLHLPNRTEEIRRQKQKLKKFDFSIPPKEKLSMDQKFRRFVHRKVSKGKGTQFPPTPKPTFSW